MLALDQGSHASRAAVFDAVGQPVVAHQIAVAVQRRGEFEVEQDPEELVASIDGCIAAVGRMLGERLHQLRAVGLATQRASVVCWDRANGNALSPVISWQDRRAHQYIDALSAHAAEVRQRTGLRLSPHYGASKLRWCLEHLPAVSEAQVQGRLCFGPLASFLVHRLLRERPCVVDPANAARTLLWNAKTGEWDTWLTRLFGIARESLPATVPTVREYGHLNIAGQSIPMRCLTGDQSAALFAFGEPDTTVLYCNIGTGAFVQAVLDPGHQVPAGLLHSVAFDDGKSRLSVMEGTVNGAAAAIDWAADELGITNSNGIVSRALAEAGEPPFFLNGVGGLGAPFWLPEFTSHFIGNGTPVQKMAAVAESIVFLISVIVRRMREVVVPPGRLIVSGGLANSDLLCQRLADASGMSIERSQECEATARGVAYLAAGRPRNWGNPLPGRRFLPVANAALMARFERWQNLMDEATVAGR